MDIVETNIDVLGGTPVFRGTRVPIKNFVDYLRSGHVIEDFLKDFPSVSLEQIVELLESLYKKG